MKVVAAVSAASEEMPSVLAVPLDELIIGLIAFLIVFGALGKFALPKIKATLDERADAIEGGLQRAEEAQAEDSRVLEAYKQQRAAARDEGSGIRTQAQSDGTTSFE
ncbi:MAG: ATP synthase F0 subunit B, partial [Actinomycetota bacterium]|nr:ATP synthase F0 subunit B [Actinomycetota bacterium]